ncbi:MAG TPA: YggS family pyridoxal phosphate-dependent enzyme [Candidatus Binatia bacterium]|nr:YggS family pyridoxal phosphate-dependent enzyme [Candidatus Binatia bacterium]
MDAPAADPAEIARFSRAREDVLASIAEACARSGRDPSAITLVAVSKTVPAERVSAALAAGQSTFGENRVQEGEAKRPIVGGGTWHLIGPLQGNKARRAIETFDVVESVDSTELARRLDRLVREVRGLAPSGVVDEARRLPVLVQVNVDADEAKAGFTPGSLEVALPELAGLGALRLDGLMTIGRLVEDPQDARPTFRHLRVLAAELRERAPALGPALSMGMSDDYPVAVEEGATIVRVGRALFGERPAPVP